MDHIFCFNSLSLPAENKIDAYSLLTDAIYGLLEINIDDSDRFILYYDDVKSNAIMDSKLAKDSYAYHDFLSELESNGELDLLSFLYEIEDKSPALNYLEKENEDFLNFICSYYFYLPDSGSTECMDTLGIAWFLNATLLSLKTNVIWDRHQINIARLKESGCKPDNLVLDNIASYEHGVEIQKNQSELNEKEYFDQILKDCEFSKHFRDWYNLLNPNNQKNVKEKLRLAQSRGFIGGEPLFKRLGGDEKLNELRFSGYPGGAIRILYKQLPNQKQAILLGFIKKSNDEGYEENIHRAQGYYEILAKKSDS